MYSSDDFFLSIEDHVFAMCTLSTEKWMHVLFFFLMFKVRQYLKMTTSNRYFYTHFKTLTVPYTHAHFYDYFSACNQSLLF